jgi:hypothetical protein
MMYPLMFALPAQVAWHGVLNLIQFQITSVSISWSGATKVPINVDIRFFDLETKT